MSQTDQRSREAYLFSNYSFLLSTEPEKSLTPSSSRDKESDSVGRTEAIVITPLSVILFILLLVVVVMRRPWNRCKENNRSKLVTMP